MMSNGSNGSRDGDEGNHEWSTSPDFDPSEPQDFSPPSNFLSLRMKKMEEEEDKQGLIGEAGPTNLNEIRDSKDKDKEEEEEIGQKETAPIPNGVKSSPVESRPNSRGLVRGLTLRT